MKLDIQSIKFTASSDLQEFIQKKVDKLETFYDGIVGGEVYLRLEKGEHSRENKVVEIKLHVPGSTLFAKANDTSFEAATDEAVEALRSQIIKQKEKAIAK